MKLIVVRVKPGSRTASVTSDGDTMVIAVREPAREGRANEATRRALAAWLGIAQSRVSLVRGATSRTKTFRVD